MSYAAARSTLITIIEAVEAAAVLGMGKRFKHDFRAGADVAGVAVAARHFSIEAGAARRFGPSQAVANVVSYDVVVVVEYPFAADAGALDLAIADDYERISRALADQSKWQRTTSTIRCVGADSATSPDAPLFPRIVEAAGPSGGRRMRISFPLEVIS